jgi:hypothetical protein
VVDIASRQRFSRPLSYASSPTHPGHASDHDPSPATYARSRRRHRSALSRPTARARAQDLWRANPSLIQRQSARGARRRARSGPPVGCRAATRSACVAASPLLRASPTVRSGASHGPVGRLLARLDNRRALFRTSGATPDSTRSPRHPPRLAQGTVPYVRSARGTGRRPAGQDPSRAWTPARQHFRQSLTPGLGGGRRGARLAPPCLRCSAWRSRSPGSETYPATVEGERPRRQLGGRQAFGGTPVDRIPGSQSTVEQP